MNRLICSTWLYLGVASWASAADMPTTLVTGLQRPVAAVVGPDGRIYVTVHGDNENDRGGAVVVIENGKASKFASGFEDPTGMVAFGESLFVADKKRIWRIGRQGKAEVFAVTDGISLQNITVDEQESFMSLTQHLFRSNDLSESTNAGKHRLSHTANALPSWWKRPVSRWMACLTFWSSLREEVDCTVSSLPTAR